ncbi:LysE/ArgO family amino acid transporter [Parendozoicomonas haliclonae]|nr:LysE/ArgO family amino acid transporter [Parendozoicomonas haliclonae]
MIIAIGAQNAWVIQKGIARNYPLLVAAICALCDITLITLGVYGAGALLAETQWLMNSVTIGGILFLGWYGLNSLRSALAPAGSLDIESEKAVSLSRVVSGTLAVTLLNPHVYLDTVMILGGIGNQYQEPDKMIFVLGTVSASIVWFFTLALGAVKLAPVLSRPKVRKGIDLLIATIMWVIAASLIMRMI